MNESEIFQLWRLFSQDRDELQRTPNSGLRQAVRDLERFDADNGTQLIDRVKYLLCQLEGKEKELVAAQSDAGIASASVPGVGDISYRGDTNPVVISSSQKSAIAQEIFKILELDRYLPGNRPKSARVRGLPRSWRYGDREIYT